LGPLYLVVEVHLTRDYHIPLPEAIAKQLNLAPDDRVVIDVVGDEVRIRKMVAPASDRFAGILQRYFPTESLADQWLNEERDAWPSR
jgi:bifunctional DNA-binding transcriptional regulator/antitoxin component of YhaV-PrlF toxin-antitoxin module